MTDKTISMAQYLLLKPTRERKQIINKETDATAVVLYSLKKEKKHEQRKDKSTS